MRSPTPIAALALAAASLLPAGCSVLGVRFQSPIVRETGPWRTGPGELTADDVQSEVMSFVDTFNGSIAQRWDQVAAKGRAMSSDEGLAQKRPELERANRMRRAALEIKLANVSAALAIASSANPRVALADVITMVTLQRMVLQAPRYAELFGEETAADLVATYQAQEDKAWRIAARAMNNAQRVELYDLINEWRRDHPDSTYVSNVRLEDFARRRQVTFTGRNRGSGSILSLVALDPLAGLDPAKQEVQKSRMLGERMFFYASRSPQVLKWQAESLYQQLIGSPEIARALQTGDRVSTAAERLTEIAKDVPDYLTRERAAAMDDLFAHLSVERRETLDQAGQILARERHAVMQDLEGAQGRLSRTMTDLRATLDAADRTATTLTTAISAADTLVARFEPQPGDPPKDPTKDPLRDFQVAAAQTADAATRLTTLVQALDDLLKSPSSADRDTAVRTVLADAEAASTRVVDRLFWRALIVVVALPLSIGLAVGLARRLARPRAPGSDTPPRRPAIPA